MVFSADTSYPFKDMVILITQCKLIGSLAYEHVNGVMMHSKASKAAFGKDYKHFPQLQSL